MFERRKAIIFYKRLLDDLIETKEALEDTDDYEDFDIGHLIVPCKDTNKKITQYLSEFASSDNYNFNRYDVQDAFDGSRSILYTIDNETDEHMIREYTEIDKALMSVVYGDLKKGNSKITNIDEYKMLKLKAKKDMLNKKD